MDIERKYKIGDLVMYGKKVNIPNSVEYYFMKPAKVTNVINSNTYPYKITLLNENKSNCFSEKELIPMATIEEELGTMLIRNQITDEMYKQLVKTLNSPLFDVK